MPNPIADPLVEGPDTDVMSDLVVIEGAGDPAVTVTINRAAKKNAFDSEVIGALREAFETLHAADGVRVVFVAGAGPMFSAGADLDWMAEAAELTESDNREDAMAMAVMLRHLHDLPTLTVALVQGGAFGGGAGLAAACDFSIATADARFSFSEVKLGLVAATISPYVIRAIGPRRARGLFATGRVFDASFAKEIGLIDEVVADAAALAQAKARIAAEIVACGPEAVAASKKLVDHVAGREIDHGLMAETARAIAAARMGEEGREGVRAFLERRKPGWAV